MLLLEDIRWRGGAFELSVPRWEVVAGEFHALAGCNGAGKSSLLKVIAGEAIGEGRVVLHGHELKRWPALTRARHLGVLPQNSSLNFPFSAGEVVALGATPLALNWRERQRLVRRQMRLTQCEHLAQRDYPRLSGGEKQRVHLARVLVQLSQADNSPLLLLDEPTSAQDLGQQQVVLELASNLARHRNFAVVAVLHDVNHSLRHATRVSLVAAGRVVDSGSPGDVLTAAAIHRHWGVAVAEFHSAEGERLLA